MKLFFRVLFSSFLVCGIVYSTSEIRTDVVDSNVEEVWSRYQSELEIDPDNAFDKFLPYTCVMFPRDLSNREVSQFSKKLGERFLQSIENNLGDEDNAIKYFLVSFTHVNTKLGRESMKKISHLINKSLYKGVLDRANKISAKKMLHHSLFILNPKNIYRKFCEVKKNASIKN